MWNLYVISVLILYAPSRQNWEGVHSEVALCCEHPDPTAAFATLFYVLVLHICIDDKCVIVKCDET